MYIKIIKEKTSHLYTNIWNEERNKQQSKGKHQIYAEIKTQNCFEKYYKKSYNKNVYIIT